MAVALLLAGIAQADFKRLHAERATSSSFLESNWNKYQENYHPTYVLDDDASTAWVEGAEGDGVGESLTVPVSALKAAKALRLVITPGYQKSKGLFAANGTPTALELVVRDANDKVTTTKALAVAAKWGSQTFDVPLTGGLASVTLIVKDVKPGTKYRDTCISDVQLFVDSDVPYDKRVEDAKRVAMVAWKKERLAAAKYFGSLPATYPFVASTYDVKDEAPKVLSKRYAKVSESNGEGGWLKGERDPKFVELDVMADRGLLPPDFDADDQAALKELRALVNDSKGGRWFAVSAKTVPRMPDGLVDLLIPEVMTLVRASDATFFEARKAELELTLKPVPREDIVPRKAALSTLKLLDGTPTTPKRAFAKHLEVIFERSDYEVTSWLLFQWGDDGLLRRVAVWRNEFEIKGGGRMMEEGGDPKDYPPEVRKPIRMAAEVWRFTVADAKVAGIVRKTLFSNIGDAESIEGLQADEGISAMGNVFTPRTKKR
ncbi:MAG: hypothetical protein Q8N26_11560 [Myxococcales bacterium]|nr:hypothetical protein [Myxococcales bacterium]